MEFVGAEAFWGGLRVWRKGWEHSPHSPDSPTHVRPARSFVSRAGGPGRLTAKRDLADCSSGRCFRTRSNGHPYKGFPEKSCDLAADEARHRQGVEGLTRQGVHNTEG